MHSIGIFIFKIDIILLNYRILIYINIYIKIIKLCLK